MSKFLPASLVVIACICLAACGSSSGTIASLPPGLVEVKPAVAAAPQPSNAPAKTLSLAQGRFFSYAMPEGWRVGEDGQFALTLVSPDNKALTIMVGNAGFFPNYPPARFVYEKLSAMQPQNLQISQPRQTKPVAGFQQAYEFDLAYSARGTQYRGLAKAHVATSYDTAVMAMTAAISDANQWSSYSAWLPLVADQVSAINGAAFGARGVMQQNLQNSQAYAQAAQRYRDWSQQNWQGVVDQRNASQDRQNAEFRENLGAVNTYNNPYDSRTRLELSTQYNYYWVNQNGTIAGTNDPGVNPNAGSTDEWKQMPRVQRK